MRLATPACSYADKYAMFDYTHTQRLTYKLHTLAYTMN